MGWIVPEVQGTRISPVELRVGRRAAFIQWYWNSVSADEAIAVAGATGFIGRELVARLLGAGHRVVALVRRPGPEPGARGETPRAASLGLFPEGGVAETCSTPGTPAFRLLPLGENPGATRHDGFHHGLLAGVEQRLGDLAGPIDPELLAGCRVLINLVGIKRANSSFGFEAAHVHLPLALADAAEAAGLTRMIHVSVVGADRPEASEAGAYLASKHRGERALLDRPGPLAITVVRPGVVHGLGDDLIRNLADVIRAAPVVALPGGGRAELAPIAVEDVAEGLLRCVERPATAGRSYDLVGPERLSLRALVERVAAAPSVARSCWVLPVPAALLRPAAAVLELASRDPLITVAQLGLLAAGVVGDPELARRELELEPGPLDPAAIERALAGFEPRLPSVRLVPDPAASRALAALGGRSPSAALALFGLLAVAALFAGPWLIAAIWLRMAVLNLALLGLALVGLRLDWRALLRPSVASTAAGVGAGLVMWAGALVFTAGLAAALPDLWAGAAELYGWATALSLGLSLAALTVIVAGEEIVWRGALGLGLAARVGPWSAVLISASLFTLAHTSIGSPLLLVAAFVAGGMWTALAIRARSLWACVLAHLLWDIALLWLTPVG
jgi:uncharacterized protein YbjT (DUF2867 family)/membrane protease YdiL (CAAX protease family)